MAQTSAAKQPVGNEDVLLRDDRGAVTVLTLNRPQARNSLSDELLAALQSAMDDIASSKSVRAVVLTANGPVFCAGHDLKEMTSRRKDADRGEVAFNATLTNCSRLMQSIVSSPKPVIAAVSGTATAAGCQLVASCDLAVASEDARFCTPGVDIGLFCSAPMVALTRNIGRKRAMEMLLLGDMISADDAFALGLVNRVVPKHAVLAEAMKIAETIASKPADTVAVGKSTFNRQLEQPLGEAYEEAAKVMVSSMLHEDSVEGIGAFIEKRKPRWNPR